MKIWNIQKIMCIFNGTKISNFNLLLAVEWVHQDPNLLGVACTLADTQCPSFCLFTRNSDRFLKMKKQKTIKKISKNFQFFFKCPKYWGFKSNQLFIVRCINNRNLNRWTPKIYAATTTFARQTHSILTYSMGSITIRKFLSGSYNQCFCIQKCNKIRSKRANPTHGAWCERTERKRNTNAFIVWY